MRLPPLPKIALELLQESLEAAAGEHAFLHLRRQLFRAHFPDGTTSEPFWYDSVDRTRLDAVVIAAHYRDDHNHRMVFLRSALRPPIVLRPADLARLPDENPLATLWELPAGLVEVEERSPEGLRSCAARELYEEVGLRIDPNRLHELGQPVFPAPGMIGERQFFFHVEVDPARRVTPPEDGSVLERGAIIAVLPLLEAIARSRSGEIADAKTELALRRLAELEW
jgi:ADP-ribose pyrophosphatase